MYISIALHTVMDARTSCTWHSRTTHAGRFGLDSIKLSVYQAKDWIIITWEMLEKTREHQTAGHVLLTWISVGAAAILHDVYYVSAAVHMTTIAD